jgi:integrase
MEITLQRRHTKACPNRRDGPNHLKCRGKRPCPLRAVGYDEHGNRVRESLGTRDLARAGTRLAELVERLQAKPPEPADAPEEKTIEEAIALFHARHASKSPETRRKYRRHLATVAAYLETQGVRNTRELRLATFDKYIGDNERKSWTWAKQVELLKQFLRFCISRGWCAGFDVKELRPPRLEEANQVVPYTPEEVARIIAACDFIGRNDYERLRARAMVLLMRFAALRVSDVVTLSRDHVQGGLLKKQAVKNRKWIRVTVRPELAEALDRLPRPKAAPADSQMYFASDTSTVRSLVKGAQRTMSAVFKLAKVPGAHCHRFRHTLASEILGKGGTVEDAANILADSPATIRRHYAKWTDERQARQDRLLEQVHGTNLAQAGEQASKC